MDVEPGSAANMPAEGEDMVARRIVMRRETWDQLVHLADALRETREIDVSATEVATIALEAGLAEVKKGQSTKLTRPVAEASVSGRRARSASGKQARTASGKQARSGKQTRSGAQARTASGASRRPGEPLELTGEERAEIQALVGDLASARGRQRTLALFLGARKKRIPLEWLRELCTVHGAYNVANFAQNMKKDGDLFEEVKADAGDRLGWRLTKDGVAEAKVVLEAALQPA